MDHHIEMWKTLTAQHLGKLHIKRMHQLRLDLLSVDCGLKPALLLDFAISEALLPGFSNYLTALKDAGLIQSGLQIVKIELDLLIANLTAVEEFGRDVTGRLENFENDASNHRSTVSVENVASNHRSVSVENIASNHRSVNDENVASNHRSTCDEVSTALPLFVDVSADLSSPIIITPCDSACLNPTLKCFCETIEQMRTDPVSIFTIQMLTGIVNEKLTDRFNDEKTTDRIADKHRGDEHRGDEHRGDEHIDDEHGHLYNTHPNEHLCGDEKCLGQKHSGSLINPSTLFGLFLGYPVVYYYNLALDSQENCLPMLPLANFAVRGRVIDTDSSSCVNSSSSARRTQQSKDHTVFSFSVPEVFVDDDVMERIEVWFEERKNVKGWSQIFSDLRLEKTVVTLPAVCL